MCGHGLMDGLSALSTGTLVRLTLVHLKGHDGIQGVHSGTGEEGQVIQDRQRDKDFSKRAQLDETDLLLVIPERAHHSRSPVSISSYLLELPLPRHLLACYPSPYS